MALLGPLYYGLVQADLEDRLSAAKLLDIFDDNNDGTADVNPVARALFDAQSYVEGALRTEFVLAELRALDPPPNEIVRLILDRAEARAYSRHPEMARFDGQKLLDRVDKEIANFIARGQRGLDADSPTASNQGGEVGSSVEDPNFPDPPVVVFLGGLGDF